MTHAKVILARIVGLLVLHLEGATIAGDSTSKVNRVVVATRKAVGVGAIVVAETGGARKAGKAGNGTTALVLGASMMARAVGATAATVVVGGKGEADASAVAAAMVGDFTAVVGGTAEDFARGLETAVVGTARHGG